MTRTYEWFLHLEDYMDPETVNEFGYKEAKHEALENCAGDLERVRKEFIGKDGLYGCKLKSVTFIEFDSTNPSHGSAHFELVVEGTKDQHKKLTKALGLDWED